jgi:hypothetical protein
MVVPLTVRYLPAKASSALSEDPPQAVTDRQGTIAIKNEIIFFIIHYSSYDKIAANKNQVINFSFGTLTH